MRTEDLLKQSQSLAARAAEPAGGAAADEPGARGEGRAARRPERRGRAQEPGGRAGPPGARGEGQAAGAHLEVQVRVPRQHVARAAHAAQQPADPLRPALAEPRRQPDAASRSSSPRRSTPPATTCSTLINDILDLSKIESGTVVVDVGELRLADLHDYVERTFRHVAEAEERRLRASTSTPTLPRVDPHRREAAAAGHQEPAVERVQVHASGAACRSTIERAPTRLEPRATRRSNRADVGRRVLRHRHRHRHPARQAADHLRGVPAGRRQHEPQVRRHGPRPGDQPRDRAPARRRDPPREHARARAARSRSTCRRRYAPQCPARLGPSAETPSPASSSVHDRRGRGASRAPSRSSSCRRGRRTTATSSSPATACS